VDLSRIYPKYVPVLRSLFPKVIWSGDASRPTLVLTFDDGPHPVYTAELLDLLKVRGAKATFFLLGNRLSSPEARGLVSEMYSAGHGIGLHGFSHRSFLCLSKSELRNELFRTRELVENILGNDRTEIRLVRPPHGIFTPWQVNWLNEWGFTPVLCSVLPGDWRADLTANQIVRNVLKDGPKFGSIVALHDGPPHAGPKVVEVTKRLLDELQDGRRFVTVAESMSY
jgi:peptidoglycan/xylan/chitin deacetylase (PgdA/CDA1 family)